ncbi:molecular chaperone [Photobacterium rosenbergii]|uniref:TorD/DmsD family molecular chaperone n=1 Tax=Photobacterium rosenbergii TaxID=294936 RepID=UPI001C98FB9A|nr:molecular chaperone TorD family protein [Photobacterium rosenbergii]MBY5946167.1 molecular chaperone TorD family protein [Photobacterium rosenbergii]
MTEQQYQTIAGLSLVSRFLYQALHQSPTAEFIDAIYQNDLIGQWPLDADNDSVEKGLDLLGNKPELKPLTDDFQALFIGPDVLRAAPWASVYLTEEQTIFGQPTLAIKAFYSQFGIEIDTGEREPEDHIGLIFTFLAHLTEMALQQEVDENKPSPILCALEKFLSEHVLTWAPRMLHIMREQAETDFYRGISFAAEGTLRQFAQLVKADYRIVKLYR